MHVQEPNGTLCEQQFLPMFTQHEIAAWKEYEHKRQVRIDERKRKAFLAWSRKGQQHDESADAPSKSLTEHPAGAAPEEELSQTSDPATDFGGLETSRQVGEEKVEWSGDAIAQLHEGVVSSSLGLLKTPGNRNSKQEILRWIFAPIPMQFAVEKRGKKVWKAIPKSEMPFGFELSCRFAGYDSERLKEGLVPLLKELGLHELFKEIEDAQQCQQRSAANSYRSQGNLDHVGSTKVSRPLDIQHARGAGKGRNHGSQTGDVRGAESRPVLHLRNRQNA